MESAWQCLRYLCNIPPQPVCYFWDIPITASQRYVWYFPGNLSDIYGIFLVILVSRMVSSWQCVCYVSWYLPGKLRVTYGIFPAIFVLLLELSCQTMSQHIFRDNFSPIRQSYKIYNFLTMCSESVILQSYMASCNIGIFLYLDDWPT